MVHLFNSDGLLETTTKNYMTIITTKNITGISFRIRLVLLCTFCISIFLPHQANASESWVEEVLLHDGRLIDVKRRVEYTSGQGELSQRFQKFPNQFSIKAVNPNNGNTVEWKGKPNFNPIKLDFLRGDAYLVVVATSVMADLKQYGCPEIPYLFFKQQDSQWDQIPSSEFPSQLLQANLASNFDYGYRDSRKTKEDIKQGFKENGYVQYQIPTTFASWSYRYKNSYRVNRYHDGCRHTIPSNDDPTHPQSRGQPGQEVLVEVLNTLTIEPERVITQEESSQLFFNKLDTDRCESLVKLVGNDSEKPELRGWLTFVNDSSSVNKAKRGGKLYCDAQALWITDYGIEANKIYFTKYSLEGRFIYRIKFERPTFQTGYVTALAHEFEQRNGYLYLKFVSFKELTPMRHISHIVQFRLKEPV